VTHRRTAPENRLITGGSDLPVDKLRLPYSQVMVLMSHKRPIKHCLSTVQQ